MPSRANLYIGRAGQMAVMAEFLIRGYNVAVPEVDVGDDIFVVRDRDGTFGRIQVKTTNGTQTKNGYSARFTIKLSQLRQPMEPEVWYVFACRYQNKWDKFLIIPRKELADLHLVAQLGSLNQRGIISLYFSVQRDSVICSGQVLSRYVENWQDWPPIEH